ncbi:MAG: hypothetical protein V1804_03440 [Patescibacteria group bacterium]
MGETKFDLTRHPIKKGEFLPTQSNPEKNIDLPVEGIQETQKKAKEFAEEFEKAPEGTVFWALTSNAPRTQEARFIFDEELKYIAEKSGALVIDLSGKMPDNSLAKEIEKNKSKKIILINGPVHSGLGIYDYNIEEYSKLMDEKGSEEKVISDWSNDPEISKKIGVDYNKVAEGFEKMLDEIENISKDILPNREIWVKGIGHSGEIEVGLASYAKKTSAEIIEKTGGKLIETMESAHITIKPDGERKIEYRGQIL